jgi:hypothetical protein
MFRLVGAILFTMLAGCSDPDTAPEILFQDGFDGATIGDRWTVDASEGNTVAVHDGRLAITAFENTFAHIERPLGVDEVRASCAIQAGAGISWTTSLFLYWNFANWCQIGILREGGGKIYVAETIEGDYLEYRLSPCKADQAQSV